MSVGSKVSCVPGGYKMELRTMWAREKCALWLPDQGCKHVDTLGPLISHNVRKSKPNPETRDLTDWSLFFVCDEAVSLDKHKRACSVSLCLAERLVRTTPSSEREWEKVGAAASRKCSEASVLLWGWNLPKVLEGCTTSRTSLHPCTMSWPYQVKLLAMLWTNPLPKNERGFFSIVQRGLISWRGSYQKIEWN